MYEDDAAGINSELRYITLELMKLAQARNKNFNDVANEFIANAYQLREMISDSAKAKTKAEADVRAAAGAALKLKKP